jgi:hypothetical protein
MTRKGRSIGSVTRITAIETGWYLALGSQDMTTCARTSSVSKLKREPTSL